MRWRTCDPNYFVSLGSTPGDGLGEGFFGSPYPIYFTGSNDGDGYSLADNYYGDGDFFGNEDGDSIVRDE